MITEEIYKQAREGIGKMHSEDLTFELENGESYPAEVLYSARMLAMLEIVNPQSTYLLKLAAQCQHLKRWGVPRANYPFDRRGYHQWRRVVMEYQLQQTNEILTEVGMESESILIITEALRNQGNKEDVNAQIILDTACLVFLKWYLQPFAAKHEQTKVADILKKTLRKMSDKALVLLKFLEFPKGAEVIISQ